ncbi:hypothetical protein [Paenibacillus sp. FSL H7-0331]|uniref:hypothetical protein n=1 Tax=Paenibacillus sp. FSL H7-0331 TaxID=1920421 RepID=UPI00096F0840|nr:hypothetical protein [Paenibacillus sp. FSL H7-0331]OMF19839.1 hypothetical protein BK127_02730 [Paenibacillus sp. FSL H7-0331]
MHQTLHKVYKIRNKETGLFSKGGTDNIWTKEGKSWSNIGHLKHHLNQLAKYYLKDKNPYINAEIVEVNYDMCHKVDVNEMFNEIANNKEKAEEAYRLNVQKWREEQERKQLQELKEKYDK